MIIHSYNGVTPKISKSCYVAENATLVGDIVVGEDCSIWFGVSIRAEEGSVRIGERVNVQDNSVIHTDALAQCVVGDGVSIGHGAIIHGATIGDNSLIGLGSILLNNCKIGKNCIIGAGTLVTQGTEIPDNSLAFGSPARVKRQLDSDEIKTIHANAAHYDELRKNYIVMTKKSA